MHKNKTTKGLDNTIQIKHQCAHAKFVAEQRKKITITLAIQRYL